jgi:hypothetical protein
MMQYDVKSYHNTVSGVSVPYRTRLKGIVISPTTSVTYNVSFCNNLTQLGTYVRAAYTVTVTIAAHGLTTGQRVVLDFTSGGVQDDTYEVTVTNANVFTVTTAATGSASGNVTMYSNILAEIDCATGTAFYTLIPGEGILAADGIYMFSPSTSVTSTIFYG